MPVPLFATSLDPYLPRIVERLAEVANGGRYILGPEVEAFEQELAHFLDVKHCVGVANGTDAITIALRALGVGPGDEVVCPSFTFYATVEATISAGATPVFCDVDPRTFCVNAETVKAAITPRTKAIVAVHLFGNVAPMGELRDLGLPVLEDAAQATGARLDGVRAGALGDAATFSFFPSKNLPCLGDGGAIATNDDDVAHAVRRLRFHGSDDKQTFVDVGYNSRLDELQAAVLRVLLPELDGWNAARRAGADLYTRDGLGEHVELPLAVDGAEQVHHLYVVRHERADELAAALAQSQIGARGYYRTPIHRQPATARYAPAGLELPGTDEAARTHLALPIGPELSEDDVREVVTAVAASAA
ncbi:MAG TPA: DegT/DnrJ/EryC1/StrS family aminotransferase [Thermoleophilaceae bacterium]|nr:DegT/DnrJ/EryC1/StrS family aminotransferase [Thermoleophilaceae bacterium]